MITTEYLKQLFADKLAKTGSVDAAFTKAVWVAYKQGYSDGIAGKEPTDEKLSSVPSRSAVSRGVVW